MTADAAALRRAFAVGSVVAMLACEVDPTVHGDGGSTSSTSASTSDTVAQPTEDSSSSSTGTSSGTTAQADESSSTGGTPLCEVLAAIGAVALADDGNDATQVLDDDIDTRWSCEGVGCWIEIELPEVIGVGGLSVAWYRGDERRSEFDVATSTDGIEYTPVFRGWSAGESHAAETYGFGVDSDARLVRLTFHGNTSDAWASILELRALGVGCTPWLQDVYLAIGQSNMAGRAPLQDEDRPAPAGVYLFDDEGQWEPAWNEPIGLNRYSTVEEPTVDRTQLGPAYTFGRELAVATGTRIGLVVNARGGTSIEQWAKEDFTGDFPLYDEAVARTRAALAANPGARLRGIIWHQGEGDNNAVSAETYVQDIAAIVAGLREDLDAPDAGFVAGEVGSWQGRGTFVNPRIQAIPDTVAHSAWVTSEGLTTHETTTDPWGPHFDAPSQRVLGGRYAEAMQMVLGAQPR